jgi:hypothetical protein
MSLELGNHLKMPQLSPVNKLVSWNDIDAIGRTGEEDKHEE